jgi:serine protease Do
VARNRVNLKQSPPRFLEVEKLDPNGVAAKAGIKSGDIVVRVGETAVASSIDLERALLDVKTGDKVTFCVKRGGSEQQCELAFIAPKPVTTAELAWTKLGLKLTQATGDLSRVGANLRGGMLITEVNSDSPAGRAGIQTGDVLVGLHQWETINIDNVTYVLKHPDLQTFYPLRFYVVRAGQIHKGWLAAE